MILRRVTQHLRKQDWTAISIELVIVIVGVFLGIELGNWNADRASIDLEKSYLDRIAIEVLNNSALFAEYKQTESAGREATRQFTDVINDPASTDSELVDATRKFFEVGWTFPMFAPVVTTYEDIEATGNLQLIRNAGLRDEITHLYAKFDQYKEILAGNMDWQIPIDARISYEFDALRWDSRTSHLFPDQTTAEAAASIRSNTQELRRVAAIHYWLQERMIGLYDEAISHSGEILERINAELSD